MANADALSLCSISDECPICFAQVNNPYFTECMHRFCRNCIKKWLVKHNTCPSCCGNIQYHAETANMSSNIIRSSVQPATHVKPLTVGASNTNLTSTTHAACGSVEAGNTTPAIPVVACVLPTASSKSYAAVTQATKQTPPVAHVTPMRHNVTQPIRPTAPQAPMRHNATAAAQPTRATAHVTAARPAQPTTLSITETLPGQNVHLGNTYVNTASGNVQTTTYRHVVPSMFTQQVPFMHPLFTMPPMFAMQDTQDEVENVTIETDSAKGANSVTIISGDKKIYISGKPGAAIQIGDNNFMHVNFSGKSQNTAPAAQVKPTAPPAAQVKPSAPPAAQVKPAAACSTAPQVQVKQNSSNICTTGGTTVKPSYDK